ncbi:cupredoxin domain-containing protein [Deinococcus sonorensis]|uniref:Cupredoxin domain-containing protein n=2 Tax=Deinococcus sonorensis TaxID=309891 RepID=A0AAU7UGV5_9DEIO
MRRVQGQAVARQVMLSAVLALGLVVAAPVKEYAFRHTPSTVNPAATGVMTVSPTTPGTSGLMLSLSGLTPAARYIAQVHRLGDTASGDPCLSGGAVTSTLPPVTADAQGRATLSMRTATARLAGPEAAYIDIRLSIDPAVVPLCAALIAAPSAASATPAAVHVSIRDNTFMPATLTVKAGTTVTWTEDGQVSHNVISVDLPDLHSPTLNPGSTYRYTFNKPGTYTYYCSFHEGMSATITVTNR